MNISTEELFANLNTYISEGDPEGIEDVIFKLGAGGSGLTQIPDAIVERLLVLLQRSEMHESKFAGHILNFFEFEALHLSDYQKQLCLDFLRKYGDEFSQVHSRQVVTELRHDHYLK